MLNNPEPAHRPDDTPQSIRSRSPSAESGVRGLFPWRQPACPPAVSVRTAIAARPPVVPLSPVARAAAGYAAARRNRARNPLPDSAPPTTTASPDIGPLVASAIRSPPLCSSRLVGRFAARNSGPSALGPQAQLSIRRSAITIGRSVRFPVPIHQAARSSIPIHSSIRRSALPPNSAAFRGSIGLRHRSTRPASAPQPTARTTTDRPSDTPPKGTVRTCYFIRNEKRLMFFSAIPVPRAMARSGSSAMWNGMPVFSFRRRSRPLINAPPPAR